MGQGQERAPVYLVVTGSHGEVCVGERGWTEWWEEGRGGVIVSMWVKDVESLSQFPGVVGAAELAS